MLPWKRAQPWSCQCRRPCSANRKKRPAGDGGWKGCDRDSPTYILAMSSASLSRYAELYIHHSMLSHAMIVDRLIVEVDGISSVSRMEGLGKMTRNLIGAPKAPPSSAAGELTTSFTLSITMCRVWSHAMSITSTSRTSVGLSEPRTNSSSSKTVPVSEAPWPETMIVGAPCGVGTAYRRRGLPQIRRHRARCSPARRVPSHELSVGNVGPLLLT